MDFKWETNKEYGFLSIIPREYDEAYYRKYVEYSKTPMGERITLARIAFIDRWHNGKLLDVGVGSGQFVQARKDTFGYDINPASVRMLKEINRYVDINDAVFPAYSFFDSFEHIKEHTFLLNSMYPKTKVFFSIPIFRDISHALRSKHFRIDEHYWYFTTQGLLKYMSEHGFACLDVENFEIQAGREDIWSFVFEKR